MGTFTRSVQRLAVAASTAVGALLPAAPAAAGTASPPTPVAYVRDGDIFVSRGTTERRLTTGGGHARPRFSPDGTRLAFLRHGQLWTMRADGGARRPLLTRAAAGASWSPDGRWLAFASAGCTGGPAVYRVSTATATATGTATATATGTGTGTAAKAEVLFPAECRGEPLPAEETPTAGTPGGSGADDLTDRLRRDDAVAWSPDGDRLAFRGGLCEAVYDDCLSIGTVSTGAERVVAAYGGGGRESSGFAVVPNWHADGVRLAFTAYRRGATPAQDQPVHLEEYDTTTGARRTIGSVQDREMAYLDSSHGVATGQLRGRSWVLVLDLTTGARSALHRGSQPSVQPVR